MLVHTRAHFRRTHFRNHTTVAARAVAECAGCAGVVVDVVDAVGAVHAVVDAELHSLLESVHTGQVEAKSSWTESEAHYCNHWIDHWDCTPSVVQFRCRFHLTLSCYTRNYCWACCATYYRQSKVHGVLNTTLLSHTCPPPSTPPSSPPRPPPDD